MKGLVPLFLVILALILTPPAFAHHNDNENSSDIDITIRERNSTDIDIRNNIKVSLDFKLLRIRPSSGITGETITLTGENFGTTQGTVGFYDRKGNKLADANIVSWNNNTIQITVPNLPEASYKVSVTRQDGLTSKQKSFRIKD